MNRLTRDELKQWIDHGEAGWLINVLDPTAFEQARIPGSHNISIGSKDFEARVETLTGGKDCRIVVYCSSFECDASEAAAKRLAQAGFGQVYRYEGGMKDWREAAYPVEGESGSVD
ncbi:rhodanese-like domain-containing protein [Thioalkalicoccus limnaeus]|uniref:Rhodanese-like domain-containing protein n=1 Tax=Thioalkalicoccus limnaeus TaxID=120681 RepID=A0ABV4BBI5_9GAMM